MIPAMRGQSSLCSSFGKTLWKAYQGRLVPSLMLFAKFFRTLSKATRKDLRRKFRKAERAPRIEMEVVSDIAPLVDEIHPLYLAVHERSLLKFETLTKDYFRTIGQRMPDRARFFIWRQ